MNTFQITHSIGLKANRQIRRTARAKSAHKPAINVTQHVASLGYSANQVVRINRILSEL